MNVMASSSSSFICLLVLEMKAIHVHDDDELMMMKKMRQGMVFREFDKFSLK